jgi:hypothetical protein
MTKSRRCRCCGRKIKIMCQVTYCGGLCESGKCQHKRKARMPS